MLKEGILNAYRNKIMSLASIGIVGASLLIFGIFYLVMTNIVYNAGILKQQSEICVYCDPELNDSQVKQVEAIIKKDERIKDYKLESKKEAFEKAKKRLLGDDTSVVEELTEDIMQVTFYVKLKDPGMSKEFISQYRKIAGVEDVDYPEAAVEFISGMSYWVTVISGFLMVILLIISMFIISNTIKLTVFARRKEINIMKYIGATDWFIRWPFIIEGIAIGIVGAAAAAFLTINGYNAVEARFNSEFLTIGTGLVKLMKANRVWNEIILIYTLVGGFIGALGSAISIRKYLHV